MLLNKALFFIVLVPGLRAQGWVQSPPPSGIEDVAEPASAGPGTPASEAAETKGALSDKPVFPVYLSQRPNLNDYTAFADGGWDGNWYVGYNNCWIVQLPAAPRGSYVRAYIGAKLGRAKTQPRPGHGLERAVIPGKIYIALSSTQAFSASQSFLVALTQELATEPDPSLINQDWKKAGWYWAEVPLKLISTAGPNYLAIYSPTEYMQTASSAPILGAAATTAPVSRAWLNRSIRGAAPSDPATALETPINYLLPALAIKLVPPGGSDIVVRGLSADWSKDGLLARFSVYGENVEAAWLETSLDSLSWEKQGPSLRHPPFIFTLPPEGLPRRGLYLRGAARDILGNSSSGDGLEVSPPAP